MDKNRTIKMVVTDLDGTLLKNDKHISDYTKKVIEDLKDRGILFVIATARPIRAVRDWLPWVSYDAGIFHNGAVMLDTKQQMLHLGIEEPLAIIREILKEYPDSQIACEYNDSMCANFPAESIWPGIVYLHTTDFAELENIIADKLIVTIKSVEEVENIQKILPQGVYAQPAENVIAMIMNRNATKTNAIRKLAAQYGISQREIVAFGDDYNDMDMLKTFGTGVAMANALDIVKQWADEICGSNEEDGVARWIEKYLLH